MKPQSRLMCVTAGLFLAAIVVAGFADRAAGLPNLVGDCESELITGATDWDNADDTTMMHDDGTHGDAIPSDNIFTLTVEGTADSFSLAEVAGHQVVGTAGSWDPQFPGTGNVPIRFSLDDTVSFYLDRNQYTDGFVPESCIVYNSWMPTYSWPGPYYVVGSCQDEFGAGADWDAADTTMKMNDAGIGGDLVPGDLIYTFKGVCTAANSFEFKVLCSYNSWRPQFSKEGFVWDFGGNFTFTTLSASDTVTFETDASVGRTRVTILSGLDTLNPRVDGAMNLAWDTVTVSFSEPMDSTSAVNAAAYTVTPSIAVLSAEYVTSSEYQLGLASSVTAGTIYTVTVDTTVKDRAGNPIDTLYDSATFGVAPVTFLVVDTVGEAYPGFLFKGSFDTSSLHTYDVDWGMGHLYEMYDDGSNGDSQAGDHIWSRLLNLVPDGGANTWQWGVTDTFETWIDGNWTYSVVDATPQVLTFEPEPGTSQDVQVTFSVDMGGQTPSSFAGGVGLEGSRYPLNWDTGDSLMSDPDLDTVYTIDITFPTGSYPWVDYKYTKSTNGVDWDWESISNRTFRIDDSSPTQILPMDCFDNQCSGIDTAVTVVFTYNCEVWSDSIDEGVWLTGSELPLMWNAVGDTCPDTLHQLTDLGGDIYQVSVQFPAGTQKFVEFKAAIDAKTECWDQSEDWNNSFILDDGDTIQYLDTLYFNDDMPVGGFIRGDCTSADSAGYGDQVHSMGDAIYILKVLYVPGTPTPQCWDALDVDDSGGNQPSMGDAIYLLQHLYVPGSPPPPAPFPDCGPDPTTDDLDCSDHGCMG